MIISRRTLMQAGIAAAASATAGRFTVAASAPDGDSGAYASTFAPLDRFVEQYMRDMRAPGMTLVLADRAGVQRVATYGFGDVEQRTEVRKDQLFQIGSISKSFIALCLLQLRDEGKLNLDKPIVEYLPWFRVDSAFKPITTHHLLTHSSGLTRDTKVFPSNPAQRHRAGYAPGEHFHYSNMAFELLGYLLWTLDGRELPEVLRRRVLDPLGMTQSEPVITLDMRKRLVKSYAAFQNDRPDCVGQRLCESQGIIFTDGAGCVSSTPRDMGAYIRMFANGGVGPKGRLLSKESFALLSHPYLESKELGPTSSYGYGIAVDKLDGNVILRHTGGMVAFSSAIMIDLDAGVGAFASINAMQNYRPNPIVQFALRLMRAQQAKHSLPAAPHSEPVTSIANAADYEGTYHDTANRKLVIAREADRLFLVRENERIPLKKCPEPDRFVDANQDRDLFRFPLFFQRRNPDVETSPVTEVIWGGEWYAGASYAGPKQFTHPKEWASYVGHYRNESPWLGSIRVEICKGQLWLDGTVPLEAEGDRFYLRDEKHSPEWITFGEVVNGRCMRIKFSGEDFWQVATA